MNKRITPEERKLIRQAGRRIFSRSELRKKAMAGELVQHFDASRPKVRMWQICTVCLKPAPKWEMTCDHKEPVQRVTETDTDLDVLGFDRYFDERVFCEESNLQRICKPCHSKKSAAENSERRKHKKGRK